MQVTHTHPDTRTHIHTQVHPNEPRFTPKKVHFSSVLSSLSSPRYPPPSFHTPHYHTPPQRIIHIDSERAHATTRNRGSVSLICAAANGGATDGKSEMVPDTICGMPLNLHSVSTRQHTLYTHTHTQHTHIHTLPHVSPPENYTRGGESSREGGSESRCESVLGLSVEVDVDLQDHEREASCARASTHTHTFTQTTTPGSLLSI